MKSDLLIRQQKFVISSDTFSQTIRQIILYAKKIKICKTNIKKVGRLGIPEVHPLKRTIVVGN